MLQVPASGYYAWRTRGPSARAQQDAGLLAAIQASHARSDGTYGAPRVHEDLAEAGHHVGRKRVARLMRAAGLVGVSRRPSTDTTHRAGEPEIAATDLVERDFMATAPNQLWVADITYVPTWAGFLYLAIVLDAWSRRVVGWAMASHLRTKLVSSALNMALLQRRPADGIHHSDHGCRYTALAFGRRCTEMGVRPSRGTVGDGYDNAMAESFFAILECELLDRRTFHSQAEARLAIFRSIEGWYSPHRRHSALGQQSPMSDERMHERMHADAA